METISTSKTIIPAAGYSAYEIDAAEAVRLELRAVSGCDVFFRVLRCPKLEIESVPVRH